MTEVTSSPSVGSTTSSFWDCRTKNLYYVDYFGSGSVLFRYDYATNRHFSASISGYTGSVSSLIPLSCALNQFLVTLGTCAAIIQWNGFSSTAKKLRELFCVEQNFPNHVITYSKADPKRRLYTGTAQFSYCDATIEPESSLYRYDRYRGVVKNFNGIRTSSGMDWNIRTRQFYFKDVCEPNLMEYQWNPLTGELSKKH